MEAATLRCPSCGATVDPGAERCAYCQASLLIRADAVFDPAGAGIESHWSCPACKAMLRSFARDGWTFDRCPACGGLWLDQSSLQHLWDHPEAEQVATNWAAAVDQMPSAAPPPDPAAAFYRACPSCRNPMNRVNCGGGVIVDVCRDHGAWFDAGELAQLGTALKLGSTDPSHLYQLLGRISFTCIQNEEADASDLGTVAGALGQSVLGIVGGIVLGAVLGSLGSRN